ncbi:hypothetical protein D3C80_523200 [compost metagenome]
MMMPARTKKGMASSEKLLTPLKIRCAAVIAIRSKVKTVLMASTEPIPMLMLIGTPMASRIGMLISMIRPMSAAFAMDQPSCCGLAPDLTAARRLTSTMML